MIYLIFTQEGLEEAQPTLLEEKATLWVNSDFLSEEQTSLLMQGGVDVQIFPEIVDTRNEKSIVAALKEIEKSAPKTEIFVEYL